MNVRILNATVKACMMFGEPLKILTGDGIIITPKTRNLNHLCKFWKMCANLARFNLKPPTVRLLRMLPFPSFIYRKALILKVQVTIKTPCGSGFRLGRARRGQPRSFNFAAGPSTSSDEQAAPTTNTTCSFQITGYRNKSESRQFSVLT